MKLVNVTDVEALKTAVKEAKGKVLLISNEGDTYNLKSKLMQYVALGKLISGEGQNLELFCEDKNDEHLFFEFFKTHPDVL